MIRKKKQLNVEIDWEIANQFAGTCKMRGTSMVAVLEAFIPRWVADSSADTGKAPQVSTAKTAFDELAEVDPEAAEGLVPFIQIQIEKARKLKVARPNRVVPEEGAGARTTDRQKKRA
jgi:hypothetical protein